MVEDRPLEPERGERLAGHDFSGDAGDGEPDHFGDEGHGAGGARIDLEDVDVVVLDGELDVHQPHHVERAGKFHRLPLHVGDDRRLQRMGWKRAGTVAGVHARLLDMLHHAADEDVAGAVGDGVDIDLDGVAQVRVEQHGALARDHHGFGDVAGELRLVMDDLHGPAAEHVRRADDEGKAELGGNRLGLIRRTGDAAARLPQAQPLDQSLESVAVFRQVDGVGGGAEDRDLCVFQR